MAKADILAMVEAEGYALATVTFGDGVVQLVQGERRDGTLEPLADGPLADALTEPFRKGPPQARKDWVLVFDVSRGLITQHATEMEAREFMAVEDRVTTERARRLEGEVPR